MATTPLSLIYKRFKSKITDDMYMELSPIETDKLLFELFENALSYFEFPRVNIYDYSMETEEYSFALGAEEINIIATYMVVEWFGYQIASVENTRMKYSGSDFKFTSQANHMQKLLQLKKDYERVGFHLQRLYKRRKADENGIFRPTIGDIMQTQVEKPSLGSKYEGIDINIPDYDKNDNGVVDRAEIAELLQMWDFGEE